MSVAFLDADQVASQLGISKAYVYKIIKRLNKELEEKGFLTICGKVNKDYYEERIYRAGKGEML